MVSREAHGLLGWEASAHARVKPILPPGAAELGAAQAAMLALGTGSTLLRAYGKALFPYSIILKGMDSGRKKACPFIYGNINKPE